MCGLCSCDDDTSEWVHLSEGVDGMDVSDGRAGGGGASGGTVQPPAIKQENLAALGKCTRDPHHNLISAQS